MLSPCWRSILLTTTWPDWYTEERVGTLLAEHTTICLPGSSSRRPSINFHVCVLNLKIIHTIVTSLQNLLGIPSLQQLAFSLYHGGFVSGRLKEQDPLRQQQRQCQSLMRMRKGVSQQQEHVNGVTANQGSDKVKYGRPI